MSTIRRPMPAVLASMLLLTLLGLTLATPLSAYAAPAGDARAAIPAGCGELDLRDADAVAELGRSVDDVFVARVAGVGRGFLPGDAESNGATDGGQDEPRTVRHNVVVTVPLAGDVIKGDAVRIDFIASSETDPTQLRVNSTYVLFTKKGRGEVMQADACDGWVLVKDLDSRLLDNLRSALAEPPPSEEPDVELTANPDVDRDGPDLGRIVAPGGAVALVGVLGLVLITRIGRARP